MRKLKVKVKKKKKFSWNKGSKMVGKTMGREYMVRENNLGLKIFEKQLKKSKYSKKLASVMLFTPNLLVFPVSENSITIPEMWTLSLILHPS